MCAQQHVKWDTTMGFWHYRLRLWLAAGIIALISCSASAWQLATSWNSHFAATRELVLSLANATAQRMAVTLRGMDVLLLDVVEKIPDPNRLTPQQIDSYRGKLGLFPELEAIGFIDAGGMMRRAVHASTRFPALPVDVSDRENFAFQKQHARENLLHVNPPVPDRLTGKQVLLLSRPLVDDKGRFGGMVSMAVQPNFVDRALTASVMQDDAAATVLSLDGVVFSRIPQDSRIVGQSIADRPFFQAVKAMGWEGSNDRSVSFSDGRERVIGVRRVPNFPLLVAVGVSRQGVVEQWWREVALHAAIQGAFISVLMIMVASLIRADNRRRVMAQQLLDRERQHVQSLEQAVQERTQELNESLSALRANEDRQRLLIEVSPAALILCSMPSGRVIMLNQAACSLFRIERSLAIGRPAVEYWCDPTQRETMIQELMRGKTVHEREIQLRRHDGEIFTALVSGTMFDYQSESLTLVAVQDISARKTLEIELARSNTDLEQFSYAVSHDLQEPLRMVSSYLALIKRRYHQQLDAEGAEFIGFAVDGAQRMSRMISDLLDYSRVNRKGNDFADVALDQALAEALSNLSAAIHDCQAQVTTTDMPMVHGDGSQLMRLLQNLIGNAIKYRRPDVVPLITVDVRAEGNQWHFIITDNGIGIDPAHAGRLFQVFQRLHPLGRYEGSGIGLAVCRRIVERHHGRIWMESDGEGQGSSFHFTLPQFDGV